MNFDQQIATIYLDNKGEPVAAEKGIRLRIIKESEDKNNSEELIKLFAIRAAVIKWHLIAQEMIPDDHEKWECGICAYQFFIKGEFSCGSCVAQEACNRMFRLDSLDSTEKQYDFVRKFYDKCHMQYLKKGEITG